MTKITLGVGADAVDVEDGDYVPLLGRSDKLATVRHTPEILTILQLQNTSIWLEVNAQTGAPRADTWDDGIRVAIDLAALRRERAPKPSGSVGGWSTELPKLGNREHGARWLCAADCGPHDSAFYWTQRHGNTPEKQAAFDDAVETLLSVPSDDPWKVVEVRAALMPHARALGYGKP